MPYLHTQLHNYMLKRRCRGSNPALERRGEGFWKENTHGCATARPAILATNELLGMSRRQTGGGRLE